MPDEMHRCRYFDDDYDSDASPCALRPGWRCAPGDHDVDPGSAGCECYGPSPDDCMPCLADDLPHTGVDEDCDLRIDEAVLGAVGPWEIAPNGPAGAAQHTPDLRTIGTFREPPRTLCGDRQRSCVLDRSGRDVRCVGDGLRSECAPVDELTAALPRGEANCADGVGSTTGRPARR